MMLLSVWGFGSHVTAADGGRVGATGWKTTQEENQDPTDTGPHRTGGEHVRALRSGRLGHGAIKGTTVREQMELRRQIQGLSSHNHRG